MYSGKYEKKSNKSRRHSRKAKPSLLLLAVVLILGAMVGSTIAYLFANTGSITNTFLPTKVTTKIDENFDGTVKNDVTVKNTGDIETFIRAAVVVTWKNDDDQVHPTAPVEETDYTVTWTMDGWVKNGDYYYYTSPVPSQNSTGVLFTDCKAVAGKTPDGYHLNVEILASAIQSKPVDAVISAWGFDPTTLAGGNAT